MEELGQLVAGLEGFVRHYGAFAVMPILAIEAVGAPVPGESLLIFASVLAVVARCIYQLSLSLRGWARSWAIIYVTVADVRFFDLAEALVSEADLCVGHGLGVCPCLSKRAPDCHHRAGASH
jgi:hypothetical protein